MSSGASPVIEPIASTRSGSPATRLAIVPAELSDHVGVYCFLNSVFGEPSQAEFQASLEAPNYQPAGRLLVKDAQRIVAHAQVLHRVCPLGPLQVPVAQLDWLCIVPKLQGQGLGTRLVRAAESRMVRSGALVGWVRTPSPRVFARLGWVNCGQHGWSCGDAHRVLVALMDQGFHLPRRRAKLHIRPWLVWEVGGLARLYRDTMTGLLGPFERTEAYWQWLMHRHAFEQLYVAIEGPELIDMDASKSPIVGYAAIKGEQIFELVVSPAKRTVAAMLLARVCHDGIESSRHTVLLHAPEADRLHEVFRHSGSQCRDCTPNCDGAIMARVLQPLALMRLMKALLHTRVITACLPPRFELGFQVGKKRYLLSIAKPQLTVVGRRPTQHTVELNRSDFTRMLLGRLDWDHALAEERIVSHTAEAAHFARVLFPPIPFWKPPLDDLKRDYGNPY